MTLKKFYKGKAIGFILVLAVVLAWFALFKR